MGVSSDSGTLTLKNVGGSITGDLTGYFLNEATFLSIFENTTTIDSGVSVTGSTSTVANLTAEEGELVLFSDSGVTIVDYFR